MLKSKKSWLLMTALLGAVILGEPPPAHAGFVLTLQRAGYADKVVQDGGASDASTMAGVITFSGNYGGFDIQVTTGSSNSASGKEPAQLTINSLSITSASGGTGSDSLVLTLKDTEFTVPAPGPVLMTSQLSTTQAPQGTNVKFQSFLNSAAGTILSLNGVGGKTVTDVTSIGATPYSLTNVTTISMTQSGTVQTTGITMVATPVPSSALLALAGLPVLGGYSWLRRRKVVPVA